MSASIPAGTITFLFTDIEGSTLLWERRPEHMPAALERHDRILREAIETHHGRIVKHTGDGCYAVFESAAASLSAALLAQQALQAEPWSEIQPEVVRVRMGIHTGEADARGGDYYGPALNRAARLMAAGHGGQVLVSAAAAELARGMLPAGALLIDLGEHRLKDLVRREHIYQLAHPALPDRFPPIRSLEAVPNNLPVQVTSFVGREREIAAARELLAGARLLTLTGSGGTGKTRLALQLGAEVLPRFPDGVWFVELASLTEESLVLPALIGVLDLRDMPGIPLLKLASNYLLSRSALLILDNCEHLIGECARLADHLLRSCPRLKILASSREGLEIPGEVSFRVPSLSLPSQGEQPVDILLKSEAALLFLERAAAVNPAYALSQKDTASIAQICQRLDGIPLAIELAAARMKLFSPAQIAAHLKDRFRLLTGGSRTALPRQQTLRAMIDWSYDLLSAEERLLLRQVAVFSGGWTFEAAEAVCTGVDVLSSLEQLVNKSLVVMEASQDQTRYRLLETIRQYGREKLFESGEGGELRLRHFDYFLRLSELAEPELRGRQAFSWFERLAPEADNLRAAVDWGLEDRAEESLILISNLIFFWVYRFDDPLQVLRWLEDLLARLAAVPPETQASARTRKAIFRGRVAKGLFQFAHGNSPGAEETFRDAVELGESLGRGFWLAFASGMWAVLAITTGDIPTAYQAAERSLELNKSYERRWGLLGLNVMMGIEYSRGNLARAEAIHQEIRQYLQEVDHPMFMPIFLSLGIQARFSGQFAEAQGYFQEGLKIARSIKSRTFVTVMQSELAHTARQSGDLAQAKTTYRKLITTWKEYGHDAAVANQLENLAFIARREGELERAARLFGAAEALREQIGVPMRFQERDEYDAEIAPLRAGLDPVSLEGAWSSGRSLSLDAAVAFAAGNEEG